VYECAKVVRAYRFRGSLSGVEMDSLIHIRLDSSILPFAYPWVSSIEKVPCMEYLLAWLCASFCVSTCHCLSPCRVTTRSCNLVVVVRGRVSSVSLPLSFNVKSVRYIPSRSPSSDKRKYKYSPNGRKLQRSCQPLRSDYTILGTWIHTTPWFLQVSTTPSI
jgi:hypothetical protein